MAADGRKGLWADVMLDLAGIGLRRLLIHPQADKEIGEGMVAVQHFPGNGQPLGLQSDEARFVHGDIAALPQTLGGIADAGLGDAQMLRHVDGADIAVLLLHHQHGLQVILRRFLNFHNWYTPSFILSSVAHRGQKNKGKLKIFSVSKNLFAPLPKFLKL